jgi:hypothetical protein
MKNGRFLYRDEANCNCEVLLRRAANRDDKTLERALRCFVQCERRAPDHTSIVA